MSTSHNRFSSSPNELPYHVQMKDGVSVITLVSAACGIQLQAAIPGQRPAIYGDRLILRSAVRGQSDMYAVFERTDEPNSRWRMVTRELTANELDNWPAYRCSVSGTNSQKFDAWLDQLIETA